MSEISADLDPIHETIEQKEYWSRQMYYIQRTLDTLREYLGSAPTFLFDKGSWWPNRDLVEAHHASPYGRADDILWALVSICRDHPTELPRIRECVHTIVCGFGGVDSGFDVQLKDGTLRYDVELNKPDAGEAVLARLKQVL